MSTEAITNEVLIDLVTRQSDTIEQQSKEIQQLRQRIDYLMRQKFASTSEKFPSNHPSLFDETSERITQEDDRDIEEVSVVRKKRGSRSTPPESLPHVRVEHDLNDTEKVCECGCAMKRIKELVSHQYDVIPAQFQVIENVRFVYGRGCGCGAKVKTSQLTPQVLPRHQVSPSFLATIAVQKFEDALPLERQAKIYKQRFGVKFTATTFSEWMIKTSRLRLEPPDRSSARPADAKQLYPGR